MRRGGRSALVGAHSRWEEGGQPYWEGEVEECINGRTVADGAYFGVDVAPIVARLLGERQPDGGWNCERANGSVRSSFDTTINVLEGLLEYERATGGTPATREARRSGEEFLLERRPLPPALHRRAGGPERYLDLVHPNRWRHDILRGLDYFRGGRTSRGSAARRGDRRAPPAAPARRPLAARPRRFRGRVWFAVDDGPGEPSRWITLRALRVLRWWEVAGRP